ncbi:MAG: hypothetical protein Q8S33_19240 [Myxococcales bacterium]|nr:hypothetical protein [Myxococcales bacterium]MDP3502480.1 hypothetical protein [Myxococcales bacterium]
MTSDSDELKFPKKPRPFNAARISQVLPVIDDHGDFSGEHRLSAVIGSQEVEVRFVEASGEFRLVEDDDVRELSRTDLKDLASALRRYQQNVPWDDGEAGRVLVGLNDAITPTRLSGFTVRSVSDLGPVVLVAGKTDAEDIDVVLDAVTGELTLIISKEDRGSKKRSPTTQEAHDLVTALRARVEGRPANRTTMLLAVVLEAARRSALN